MTLLCVFPSSPHVIHTEFSGPSSVGKLRPPEERSLVLGHTSPGQNQDSELYSPKFMLSLAPYPVPPLQKKGRKAATLGSGAPGIPQGLHLFPGWPGTVERSLWGSPQSHARGIPSPTSLSSFLHMLAWGWGKVWWGPSNVTSARSPSSTTCRSHHTPYSLSVWP